MSFKSLAVYPPTPVTARGTATKLSASKGKITYGNGRIAVLHDINNPGLSTAYAGHTQNVTVAKISPTGYYCASADAHGTVRVWDLVGEDQTLKGEYRAIAGRINDLEWDGESKRIIAVGDGREKFGHAFMMDTGTSTGEIIGHTKVINAVAIRHQRPFRAATAGDDTQIVFHTGVPFKYEKTIKNHTKFVQDVRYAPSGDHFASVGSDSKIFLYDGKTGETIGDFGGEGHKGSIMACSWSPDSKTLVTSAADCTVKLWDVETRTAVTSYSLGSGIHHQQVGAVWSGEADIVSLSMSGDLNVFDKRVADKPGRVIKGPQKPITSTALPSSSTFLAGTADGRVVAYSVAGDELSEARHVAGDGHTNYVSGLASAGEAGKAWSIGYDDRVREVTGSAETSAPPSTSSQPRSVAAVADGTVFVVELGWGVEVFQGGKKVGELKTKYTPGSVAAVGGVVAVGGEDDTKVHLYDWTGSELKETGVLEGNRSAVSAVAVSPDGKMIAAGETSGKIFLFDVAEKKLITSRWSFHSGRINALSFTSDSKHLASASLDTNVYIWSVEKQMRNIAIKGAAPGGVNAVTWLGEGGGGKQRLASAGADACVRVWDITFH
ncbi:WD40-repeat-containing domain protein [Pterulicium gracile]|uniref:WD40-repeat-containing domain protein n=1 Tax=Pterulicium gracile TaxID=1884261 RepID=A0A5C3QHA3_9AGAR|nr:WD40-repeat-containing domain protein [Pterula gracilis]